MTHKLTTLLNPASIAVYGASQKKQSVGNEAISNLIKVGYQGVLYAVHPFYQEVEGIECYQSLSDLPTLPEHVIFAIADHRIEAALDEIIDAGIKSCTIFSSLSLSDDVIPPLKERLALKIKKSGLLVVGANGMGFYNVVDKVIASGFDSLIHKQAGNIALLSQSGAGMSGIVDCEQRLSFNFTVSSGQELSVTLEDYLDYVLHLPTTQVVGIFMETSRQPEKLIAAFELAQQKHIPIVILKVGRTALSAELAISHSGALAGTDASYAAVFERFGIQRVDDMDQLATTLMMFAQPNAISSGALVSLHDSGGQRQLLIDLAEQLSVPLTNLTDQSVKELQTILDAGLPPVNPLDGWGASGAKAMSDSFTVLLKDDNAALGAVIHDRAPEGKIYPDYLHYLKKAHNETNKPVFLVSNRQGSGSDQLAIDSTLEGFPVIDGVSQFLLGAKCMMDYRDFLQRPAMTLPSIDYAKVQFWKTFFSESKIIDEVDASRCLADFGLPMVESHRFTCFEELTHLIPSLNFPVVLKTAASGINHKSDVGGVRLNIENIEQLNKAYQEMSKQLGRTALVAPMIKSQSVEMILGIVDDDQFGPLVVIGFGGLYTELLKDVAFLLPPFDAQTATRAVNKLHMRPMLNGLRGSQAFDVNSFSLAAANLSIFAVAMKDHIKEVDINPINLMHQGCIGLDALITLKN